MSFCSARSLRVLSVALAVCALVVSGSLPAAAAPEPQGNSYAMIRGRDGKVWHVSKGEGIGPLASTSPTGLSPGTIKSVYGFSASTSAGTGKTIAIVDAYDDLTAESDLGVFSQTYGLPACTTANGCFKKVNQTGGTKYPRTNSG